MYMLINKQPYKSVNIDFKVMLNTRILDQVQKYNYLNLYS